MYLKSGLTKDNFFNEAQRQYPKAMKIFLDWIDEYKKAVEWSLVFNEDASSSIRVTKFHELPYAMQSGIWMEFLIQNNDYQYFHRNLRMSIKNWLTVKYFQNI